ncbi:hypothetical protein LR48_Vigan10g262000 [Vigna angularis]|uniref:Uncharacterized protein n=1 Tax=Phaseolus angularis TaxID=3914 RepID=A0A0L9VP43_PHAAN|nr:hypothetical protein LR48_Vigan10g262000 [Vigna angularis]
MHLESMHLVALIHQIEVAKVDLSLDKTVVWSSQWLKWFDSQKFETQWQQVCPLPLQISLSACGQQLPTEPLDWSSLEVQKLDFPAAIGHRVGHAMAAATDNSPAQVQHTGPNETTLVEKARVVAHNKVENRELFYTRDTTGASSTKGMHLESMHLVALIHQIEVAKVDLSLDKTVVWSSQWLKWFDSQKFETQWQQVCPLPLQISLSARGQQLPTEPLDWSSLEVQKLDFPAAIGHRVGHAMAAATDNSPAQVQHTGPNETTLVEKARVVAHNKVENREVTH